MISALLLFVAFGVFIYFVLRMRAKLSPDKDAPVFSIALPIIGSTHLLWTDTIKLWDTIKMIIEVTRKQGGVIRTRIGLDTYYVITDAEDAATVANECLEKHYIYKFGECLYGQSLIVAPVPMWKRDRKLLAPAFSLPVIHGFMDLFNDQARKLVDELSHFAGKGPFEAAPYITNNMLRGICYAVFGANNLQNKETFDKYLNGINDFFHESIERFQKIWLHSDLIYKLSGRQRKLEKIVKTITNITNEIIRKVQNDPSLNLSYDFDDRQMGFRTFLEMYLKIYANNDITNKKLREQLELTIIAAYDTSSIQFQTILVLLGSFPEIQKRVFDEIMNIIGPKKNVDKEDLRKLVYTEAVIKEAIRFLPPSPIVARYADHDTKLKNCTLRGGSNILIMLHGINHDTSWGPDADQFRPERWLESGGVPDSGSYFAAFSIGKRGCIGKTYVLTSLKVTLAHFVRNYQIEADYTKMRLKFDLLLKHVDGHEIIIKRRKSTAYDAMNNVLEKSQQ